MIITNKGCEKTTSCDEKEDTIISHNTEFGKDIEN
jgi:hypothetical protein